MLIGSKSLMLQYILIDDDKKIIFVRHEPIASNYTAISLKTFQKSI